MHGHGYAPPPQRPSSAQLVGLRVLFVTLALISCGFLSWVPLLRLAIVTRAVRDWVLFAASGFVVIASLMLIGSEPTDDLDTFQENLGLFGLLGGAMAAVAYYLFAEIRHFAKQPYAAPYARPQGPPGPHTPGPQAPHLAPPPAYGYPAQPGPAQQVTRPTGMPQPGPQAHGGPQHPGPARIDQVRAELDELSSLLRQDGTRPPGAGDGRAEGETR
ncbi:hypothetical protein [Streptomyces cavernicola]|uniref:Integral membrane protein n=1 Tax=Streptomyces cavernicola TaxID=3043613 RepID=A0ABT6S613_9ACTN|nr:hypothetical protein [Streptomyces sp. B-S-A6]MDI3403531.1 hypothetical protein [Streptomyces sp. B-S-A6]